MKINLNRIEIEIITACNLKCFGCDRSSQQAPSAEKMTKEQMVKFIDQSNEIGKKWDYIAILGGEPTMHPDLLEFLDLINSSKICKNLQLTSNGYGDRVKEVLSTVPSYVSIRNTSKTTPEQNFVAYNVAPKDVGYDYINKNKCVIPSMCGIGLTRYGFYPCGAGASIDRIFGLGIGIKHLRDVTEESLSKMLPTLCGLCGHSMEKLNSRKDKDNGKRMSKSWIDAYANYKTKKPELELY